MKNFLLLIIVVVLLAPSGPFVSATPVGDSFDYLLAEGMVAMQVANTDFASAISPENTVKQHPITCKCHGTGKIKSGDGIIDIPCPYGDDVTPDTPTPSTKCQCGCGRENCKCGKSAVGCAAPAITPFPVTAPMPSKLLMGTEEKPIYYSYLFSAVWCGPCQSIKDNEIPKLKNVGWKFTNNKWEEGTNVVLVDIDEHPELARQYLVDAIPRLIVVRNGVKIGDKSGFMTYLEFANFHNDTINADKAKRNK